MAQLQKVRTKPDDCRHRIIDRRRFGLKHVQDEVVAAVEATIAGIVVVPLFVVDRDSHFLRVAVVQAIATAVVLLAPEILWVVHVGIVIEAIPITSRGLPAPGLAVSTLLGRSGLGDHHGAANEHDGKNQMTEHCCFPLEAFDGITAGCETIEWNADVFGFKGGLRGWIVDQTRVEARLTCTIGTFGIIG